MYEMVKCYGKVLTDTIMKNFDGLQFVKDEHQNTVESIKWTSFSANRRKYIIAKSRWYPKIFDGTVEQDSDKSGSFLISSGDTDIENIRYELLLTRSSSKLVFRVHFPEINNCDHSHCLFIRNRSTEIYTMLPAYEFSNELKFEYQVDCKEETFEFDKDGFLSLEVYLYLILRKTAFEKPIQKTPRTLTRKRSIEDDPCVHKPELKFRKRSTPRKNTIVCDSGPEESTENGSRSLLKRKLVINNNSKTVSNLSQKRGLFEKQLFPDVIFEVGKTKIKAHKGVLANASPVFLEMFRNSKDIIRITDIKPNTLVDLFNYIYTGKFEAYEEEATIQNLLIAARKFEIEDLVTINSYLLCKFIRVDNAALYLQLAKENGFDILKTYAVKLISTEFDEKQLTRLDSTLLTEVLLMTRSKIKDEPKT